MGQEQRCWQKEDKTNQLLFKFDSTSQRLVSSKLGVAISQFLQKQINIMAISHLLNFSAGAQQGEKNMKKTEWERSPQENATHPT